MPLFKGVAGKATPHKAISYITRKDKAQFVDVQNLFSDEDYAEQFRQTAKRFGKGTERNERKYYHFKLSPDRADNADSFIVQEYAKACAEKMFEGCECVIATHTDTQTVHAHIIVNAVHPVTGRKLHFNDDDYTHLKDMANEIGKQFGFTPLDFRKKSKHRRTADEQHIILKGGTSWKEELREVIEESKLLATNESEFIAHLSDYGVKITRSGKDYSYLHPKKQKAIRGDKLGENYTKTEVLNVIGKFTDGAESYSAGTVAGNKRGAQEADGKRTAQRGLGDIQREMQRLDITAEYARLGVDGERARYQERQRLLRQEAERKRTGGSAGNADNSAGRATVQSRSEPNNTKRDNSFSK